MSSAGIRGWPIFARTFLLLLGALAVAYAVGIVPLVLRKPTPAVRLSEVVALLSTRMPSNNPLLRVSEIAQPPPPDAGYSSPPPLRELLAQWMDVPEDRVRFYVAGPGMLPPLRRMEGSLAPGPLAMDTLDFFIPSAMAQAGPPGGAMGGQGPVFTQRREGPGGMQRTPMPRYREPLRNGTSWASQRANERREAKRAKDASDRTAAPAEAPVTAAVEEPWPTRPPPDPSTAYLRQYLPPYARIAPTGTGAPTTAVAAAAPQPVAATPTPPRRVATVVAPDRGDDAAVHVGTPESLGATPQEPRWRADSTLPFAFVAAVRQADGRWRVVERVRTGAGIGEMALMVVLGLAALLPLAWWFSRALAGPIRRFAVAADHMGQDADAPPVPLEGPAEIVRAAASFNAMQARINRLVRERTQMVAAIAHDLRTPLARLSFRLDQLPPDAREKASADIAEMSQMIEAALDFIREQHRSGLRERLDLRLLVESVSDELADVGHDVICVAGSPAPLQGDPLALRRMVGNLVDNALKYGQRARLQLREDGDDYVVQIDDDGPGVDPARSEQLFMPFVRGETSRNRETGGIGLGLATARSIALAHGGDIRLDNRPGGGLRVSVALPRAIPSQRPSPRVRLAGM
ncbi:HAMP domain-containing sensor histidine kinase [Lysobacter sp. LF1]|uniref:histidine kinase n=1 Tax=Lysobacter stagni TaxID=3045172 RepID=A0ABT6XCE7_9GAMM|nr:HAMP domain-containing sensor histidine kinase [Lysobacter sp. LF1]MDI9237816.1 HAMP domain-containing sensor histidine kinase [Lysobacter sp. LF1]